MVATPFLTPTLCCQERGVPRYLNDSDVCPDMPACRAAVAAAAPLAHLSAFRHAWRLHDIMNARHLERIWEVVRRSINASTNGDVNRPDPLIQSCIEEIAGACWARPRGKCGIYGA